MTPAGADDGIRNRNPKIGICGVHFPPPPPQSGGTAASVGMLTLYVGNDTGDWRRNSFWLWLWEGCGNARTVPSVCMP